MTSPCYWLCRIQVRITLFYPPHLLTVCYIDQIYFQTLDKFKVKRSYANVANDRTVPYWTAGMEIMDYFYESKGKLDM